MGERVPVHLYRALQQAGLMQAVGHFRVANGGDGAPEEVRLLLVSAPCPNFGEFGIGPKAVSGSLLSIGWVNGNRFPGGRFGLLQFAVCSQPMGLPNQRALLE